MKNPYYVKTIITPIDYGLSIQPAIMQYNLDCNRDLSQLDARILRVLGKQPLGMQAMKLRQSCRDTKNIFSAAFNKSINNLLAIKLITRREHTKYVYYNITAKGQSVLDNLNTILTQIVEEEYAAYNNK